MRKPSTYETTEVKEGGNKLQPGGYICEIVGVREQKSKSGLDMIVVAVDIAEGEHKGHFTSMFNQDNRQDKKFPNAATQYIVQEFADGATNEQFKKFITYAEKSNNFTVNWEGDWSQFKGKKIGATFRREEFEGDDGNAFATKLAWFNTVDQIKKGVQVPKDKLLNATIKTVSTRQDDYDLPF